MGGCSKETNPTGASCSNPAQGFEIWNLRYEQKVEPCTANRCYGGGKDFLTIYNITVDYKGAEDMAAMIAGIREGEGCSLSGGTTSPSGTYKSNGDCKISKNGTYTLYVYLKSSKSDKCTNEIEDKLLVSTLSR